MATLDRRKIAIAYPAPASAVPDAFLSVPYQTPVQRERNLPNGKSLLLSN